MRKCLFLLLLLSFQSHAQALPEHLEVMLSKSQEYFEIYNDKTPEEIDDGVYDDSEYMLFSQIDQVSGLNLIFSKEEIKDVKTRMVMSLSDAFNSAQLLAIAKIGKSDELNKRNAARFFEVALEYKIGGLRDILILKKLAPKISPRR